MQIPFPTGRIGPGSIAVLAGILVPAVAAAQPDPGYADEPTGGVTLPAATLAGEHDAFSAVHNPAGLRFLRGWHAGLAVDLADDDQATGAGPGLGLYLGRALGGGLLPPLGLGAGVELLRPPGGALVPEPGTPTRITLSGAVGLGQNAALGLAWHRFFDDPGQVTRGLGTWDLGLSARLGAHWAVGAVVRDLSAPALAGALESVQRRYEVELVSRPTGTDRLTLALGGRIGEVHADVDGWLRWSLRLARGTYLEGEAVTRALRPVAPTAAGSERELRLTAGLSLSFGAVGAGFYGTGVRAGDGSMRLAGGTVTARLRSEQVPSVLGRARRIERVDMAGELDARATAALLLRLRALRRDAGVVAVFVRLDDIATGWASAQELREALLDLRGAGKRVFVSLVSGTTRDYFVASAADRIYVDPAGGLRLIGFAGTTLYFKGALDELGVAAEFEKIEEYKSAPEAWTRTGPSAPAQRMRNELYDSLYGELVTAIAQARDLDEAAVRALIDGGPYTAGDLAGGAAAALVDAVATAEQVAEHVASELGRAYPVAAAPRERPASWAMPGIAIISIEGDIVSGKSRDVPLLGRKLVGHETVIAAIAAARTDPRVGAIVLRIDSPGGSAVASELMAREVFATRGVKPIICSLGDVAASGGYFAAAGCDVIIAEPMSITGSIGIFYGKIDFSTMMDRLGLSWVTYQRGSNAAMDSMFQPYTPADRALIKEKMRYLYERFLDTVAEGRGMTREQVDAVGRGRVWSGKQAREVNLVDELGSLDDAITLARQRAGLGEDERAEVMWLPRQDPSLLQTVLGLSGLATADAAGPGAGDPGLVAALAWSPVLRALLAAVPASVWAEPHAAQARLPFEIVWE